MKKVLKYESETNSSGNVKVKITEQSHRGYSFGNVFLDKSHQFHVYVDGVDYHLTSVCLPDNFLVEHRVFVRGSDKVNDRRSMYFTPKEFRIFKVMVEAYNAYDFPENKATDDLYMNIPSVTVVETKKTKMTERHFWVLKEKTTKWYWTELGYTTDLFDAHHFETRKEARDLKLECYTPVKAVLRGTIELVK